MSVENDCSLDEATPRSPMFVVTQIGRQTSQFPRSVCKSLYCLMRIRGPSAALILENDHDREAKSLLTVDKNSFVTRTFGAFIAIVLRPVVISVAIIASRIGYLHVMLR